MNTIIYNNSTIKNINSIQNFKLNTKNKYLNNNLIINIDTVLNPPNDYFFIERTASQYSNNTISQIRKNLFTGFYNLIEVSLPQCSYIESQAFYYCTALTSVSFPQCSYIESQAFYGCTALTFANFPQCSSIGWRTFSRCSALTSVSFPQCSYIGSQAFMGCTALTSISFPQCSYIGSQAFYGCSSLNSIYLMSNKVVSLINSNTFTNTKITTTTGSIIVPTSLVNSYKANNIWSYFSNRIFGA